MKKSLILSLCDFTGNMVRPWAEAGYECVCVDRKHPEEGRSEGSIRFVCADVQNYLPPRAEYAIVFAFPPCTDLAISGARWFRGKGLGKLSDALATVEACRVICEWAGGPWMIENPVSTLSTYWRPPDHTFDPYEYGGYEQGEEDTYTKRTCLWTGGGFRMPDRKPIDPTEGSRMHLMSPSDDRAAMRSETPRGFARAVFMANHYAPVFGKKTWEAA